MTRTMKLIIGLVAALVVFGAGYFVHQQTNAREMVYICPGIKNGHPHDCANLQEFSVFDTNGAPIYSVGEAGGDAVFGDNRSVFPPGDVFHPAIVESYTTPAAYGSKTCKAPALWISPSAFFSCVSGAWVQTFTP
jgi:hypothetical protein